MDKVVTVTPCNNSIHTKQLEVRTVLLSVVGLLSCFTERRQRPIGIDKSFFALTFKLAPEVGQY